MNSKLSSSKFQHQNALISEFPSCWEVSHIWTCSARPILSEFTSHTPGSFLELDPTLWTKFQRFLVSGFVFETLKASRGKFIDFSYYWNFVLIFLTTPVNSFGRIDFRRLGTLRADWDHNCKSLKGGVGFWDSYF